MSQLLQKLVSFFDPRPAPSPEFEDRMKKSRTRAVEETRAAVRETRELRRKIETMSDRIILDPPRRREMRHERS